MRMSKNFQEQLRHTETEVKKKKTFGDKVIALFMPRQVDAFTSKEDKFKIEQS